MKQNSIAYLAAITAAFATAGVIGGVSGSGLLIAIGAGGGLVGLALIPALHNRIKKADKIRQKQDAIVVWEYANDEIREIVSEQKRACFKRSMRVSVLLSICMAVIFTPFVYFAFQDSADMPLILWIGTACIILPWLSLLIAPAVVRRTITRYPCVTMIGRDYILAANRYLGVNDRHALKADSVRYEAGENGAMGRIYVHYGFLAMRPTRTFHLWVDVPVPRGRETEAAALDI